MDSIGDNVMAIICVVVGILIIGCALVPIVDNASVVETETTVTEEVTGYNTLASETGTWYAQVDSLTITTDGTTITVNDEEFTETYILGVQSFIGYSGQLAFANPTSKRIAVTAVFDSSLSGNLSLSSGTITFDGSTLAVTGTTTSSEQYSHSASYSSIYSNLPTEMFTADESEWYGKATTPIVIGEEQKFISNSGAIIVTTSTTELPSGVTMVLNDNHTASLSFSSGEWYGPYKWVGYTTTTETTASESEYAGLYAMIPVLCILGMAYVLIRRFY